MELDLLEMIKSAPPVRVMLHVALVTMVIIMDVVPVRQILRQKPLAIYNLVQRVHAYVLLIIMVIMDRVQHAQMDMKILLVIHNYVQRVLVQQSHPVRQVNTVMAMDVQHVQQIQCRRTLVTHKTVQYAHVNVKRIILGSMELVTNAQQDI